MAALCESLSLNPHHHHGTLARFDWRKKAGGAKTKTKQQVIINSFNERDNNINKQHDYTSIDDCHIFHLK